MSTAISKQRIKSLQMEFNHSPKCRLARNAATRAEIKKIGLNWDKVSRINHHFSHTISNELPITNQKKTGRCWLFAATNLLRIKIARKYKLDTFELSQSYLYFWDKLEKANFFLENIIETASEPWESRIIMHLLSTPMQDGGQWHMFANLVMKYGVVPQEVYPDTECCIDSGELNYILTAILRDQAVQLRSMIAKGKNHNDLQMEKERMLGDIYRILAIHMGPPPYTFDWEFIDKDKKYHSFHGLTPNSFLLKHVKCNLNDYICLVHSPRKHVTPFDKTYTIQYLGNVIEGAPIKYVNVHMDEFKEATLKSLLVNEPVWFGCDVGKRLQRDLGVMDLNLFDYQLLYDIDLKINKEMRMLAGESKMTHAMLFTGVNLIDTKPQKWKVENSWGDKLGDKGYFIMTDDWFDEYMFEVAIHKKYLSKKIKEVETLEPTELPPWDPLGALAN